MGAIRAEFRAEILKYFETGEAGIYRNGVRGTINLVQINDAMLQPMLEEVWAGVWRDAPSEVLAKAAGDPFRLPGVDAALRRRRDT